MYIKIEKVKVLYELCNDKNHQMIIPELLEYCYDPSPEFSSLSLEILWRISLKLENCLESIIKIFQKILKECENNTFINHLFNKICIGMQFIERKYKNIAKFKLLIPMILSNYEKIVGNPSKIAYLYFFMKSGQSSQESAVENISIICEDFENEDIEVQLVIVSALMKTYLNFSSDLSSLTKKVFQYCTEASEHPDLRDRAFIYWRLISNYNVKWA